MIGTSGWKTAKIRRRWGHMARPRTNLHPTIPCLLTGWLIFRNTALGLTSPGRAMVGLPHGWALVGLPSQTASGAGTRAGATLGLAPNLGDGCPIIMAGGLTSREEVGYGSPAVTGSGPRARLRGSTDRIGSGGFPDHRVKVPRPPAKDIAAAESSAAQPSAKEGG